MKLLNRLVQEIRNVLYGLEAGFAHLKPVVEIEAPYVCQFAKPEQAEPSLRKTLEAKNDPHWKESGAASPERYAAWAFTMCGMASFAMALGYFKDKNIKPAELAEDALKSGVYEEQSDGISSMRYREFARWVGKYGLTAEVYSRLSIKAVQYALSKGKLPIVSVNPNIRGYDTAPLDQKGGHLVLVTGYDLAQNTISIHNPSGFVSTDTQINHKLSMETFKKYYAGRGVLIS